MNNVKLLRLICVICIGLMLAAPCEASMCGSAGRWLFRYGGKVVKLAGNYTDDVFKWAMSSKSWDVFSWFSRSKLGKLANSLPHSMIDSLAKMSIKDAGKALSALKLSDKVLEDTWLRVLVKQGKLSIQKAGELFGKLGGVAGFSSTLRKVSSTNKAQRAGHLFELNLAECAKNIGFKVAAIGKKFRDPAKKALTDLDIWLVKGGKNIYIEAKNYADVAMSSLAHFRADMDSLVSLGEGVKVFVISHMPSSDSVVKLLKQAADQRGVKLIFGKAADAIKQIKNIL